MSDLLFNGLTPSQIKDMYDNGFKGSLYDPEKMAALLSSIPHKNFSSAAPDLKGSGAGKLSTPYKSVIKLSKERPYLERQTTGDCVSHGTRNAVDVSRAVQIDIHGAPEDFICLGATEGIYGCRGHGGQGMACSEAAQFVHKNGGILLRKAYGKYDLSKYDASYGTGWGRSGVPNELVEEAKKHQVKTLTQIRNINEARDALANGYGIAVCSGYGFSSTRDDKGFARQQGSWSHCMAWTACDDTGSEPAFLVQNSWGKFNDGGHPSWGPIPDGSFLIHADVADRMLRSDGSFAFSAINGFPAQDLPDYGTNTYL